MKVYITRPPAYASSPDHVVRVVVDEPNQRIGVEMCIVFSPSGALETGAEVWRWVRKRRTSNQRRRQRRRCMPELQGAERARGSFLPAVRNYVGSFCVHAMRNDPASVGEVLCSLRKGSDLTEPSL
jgi:hypothetical protein